MNRTLIAVVVLSSALAFPAVPRAAEPDSATLTNAWTKLKEDGRRAFVAGKIKAAFADRKDIAGRFIRVRFDGETLHLAGFVPNKETARAAETLSCDIAKTDKISAHWETDPDLQGPVAYRTYVSEQTEDGLIKSKVLVSLAGPAVTPQLTGSEVLEVTVAHGKVVVYLVADAPLPRDFDLTPYIKPITGVTDFRLAVVKTFP